MYNNSRPVSYGDTQELTLYYNSFNPPIPGELIYDSKNRRLVIGDGSTPFALLKDINQQSIEDLINKSYIVIKEDVASLNNSLQSVEAGYRSEVSKIQEELSASATLYSQISNTIVVDILPDNPDTSKVYYTQHYNQYFVYDYENTTWKTIKSNSSNVISVEDWSEAGKDINKIYYTSTNGLLTYYYYTKETPKSENPKWLSTQKPFTLLSDESLDNVENKSLLYYRYIPYIYYYYKDGEWKTTQSPEEAGVKVDTASVVTSINNGESNVNINADKINFVSKAFNIYPSDGNGNKTSTTPNFSVDNKGNVKIKGVINATSGYLNSDIRIGEIDRENIFAYAAINSSLFEWKDGIFYALNNSEYTLLKSRPADWDTVDYNKYYIKTPSYTCFQDTYDETYNSWSGTVWSNNPFSEYNENFTKIHLSPQFLNLEVFNGENSNIHMSDRVYIKGLSGVSIESGKYPERSFLTVDDTIYINPFAEGMLQGTWVLESGEAVTSDINKKNSISKIDDTYSLFFDNIEPVLYKYNDGTSDRIHVGFIAQQVNESLKICNIDSKDFAGLVVVDRDDPEKELWTLRYDEFIALNTNEIQKLKQRVKELEDKLKEIN